MNYTIWKKKKDFRAGIKSQLFIFRIRAHETELQTPVTVYQVPSITQHQAEHDLL